jgi:hypothetical protein
MIHASVILGLTCWWDLRVTFFPKAATSILFYNFGVLVLYPVYNLASVDWWNLGGETHCGGSVAWH